MDKIELQEQVAMALANTPMEHQYTFIEPNAKNVWLLMNEGDHPQLPRYTHKYLEFGPQYNPQAYQQETQTWRTHRILDILDRAGFDCDLEPTECEPELEEYAPWLVVFGKKVPKR